jgi:type II secretory pathway component GspD/PulD (secretin)
MKPTHLAFIILTGLAAAGSAAAQPSPAAAQSNAVPTNPAPASVASTNPAPANAASNLVAGAPATSTNVTPGQTLAISNAPATNSDAIDDTVDLPVTNALRMNFHDAPLNVVLKYLSKRMGIVITQDVEVHGNATIISEQPVKTSEVIDLLCAALAKNNYSVSTNGHIMTITSADNAISGAETPVKQAVSLADIPVNDQIATIILPVHTLNPTQLIKDLDQLIPSSAKVAANEAGNAVIMTARQKDIHHFFQIITALDSSSVSEVGVFIMKYGDAKSVASELKEIFQSPDSSVARSDARQRFSRSGGGGFASMFGGGGGSSSSSSSEESKNAANKAVFVSDDQMNAVVASAPPDYFPMITNVISELDQPSQDVTIVKTFKLKNADAQETADELVNLFPDAASSSDQSSRAPGMRFFTPPWMQQSSSASAGTSDRMKKQTSVRAVPDLRTASVIVTASKDLMEQIAGVIEELDHDPSMIKHVYSFDIDSADPLTVQATMTALFAGQNTRTPQNNNTSALEQRANTAAQQQQTQTSTFGASGSGGTSGLR